MFLSNITLSLVNLKSFNINIKNYDNKTMGGAYNYVKEQ